MHKQKLKFNCIWEKFVFVLFLSAKLKPNHMSVQQQAIIRTVPYAFFYYQSTLTLWWLPGSCLSSQLTQGQRQVTSWTLLLTLKHIQAKFTGSSTHLLRTGSRSPNTLEKKTGRLESIKKNLWTGSPEPVSKFRGRTPVLCGRCTSLCRLCWVFFSPLFSHYLLCKQLQNK